MSLSDESVLITPKADPCALAATIALTAALVVALPGLARMDALVGKQWVVRPYVGGAPAATPRASPLGSAPRGGDGGGGGGEEADSPDVPGRTPLTTPTRRGRSTRDLCRSFPPLLDPTIPPHTLILGTMPSVTSFAQSGYYMTPSNAFWWIVGDALGFVRAPPPGGWVDGHGRRCTPPRFITDRLLHANDERAPRLEYAAASAALTAAGYAVWDVLGEAVREGSTDPKIERASEVPNDVRALLEALPTVRRVCFSSGHSTAKRFARAHRGWLAEPGAFTLARGSRATRAVFGKLVPAAGAGAARGARPPIELCVMLSVSAAYAAPWKGAGGSIYVDKRAQWFRRCFRLPTPPGEAHHYSDDESEADEAA